MFSLFKKIIGRNKKESVNVPNYDEILPGLPADYPVVSFERVVGYREEYTGYTAVHFFKGEEKILSLDSVLFPNTIQTGMTGLGYELISRTPEEPFVPGRRTEVYEEGSHHRAFVIRYLAVEKYEIILGDNQLIAVHCHPGRYVFSKNGHEIATIKRGNRCRTLQDDPQMSGEPFLECTYGSWMSNLEILSILFFPVIG